MIATAAALLLMLAAVALAARGTPAAADDDASQVDRVDAILPQTQCEQCDYPGCRPYAEAIVRQDAPIDRCPPGGRATARALAELLGRDDPGAVADSAAPRVYVVEADCIGCTKCIQACPVDAIVGAAGQMHTVIDERCTGCKLCIPPCPVDCIATAPRAAGVEAWKWPPPVSAYGR